MEKLRVASWLSRQIRQVVRAVSETAHWDVMVAALATTKGAEILDVAADHDIPIADEPVGFAAQVLRLLHNQSLRDQFTRDARLLVEQQYDWSQIGERATLLAEEMVGERGRAAGREHAG
jgi:hypothetical protein